MKKILCYIIIFTLVCTGCGLSPMKSLYSKDSKISSASNSFNLNSEEQSIDTEGYTGKLEFEGMDTIWKFETEKDAEIKISYLLSVRSGKAKLVLINPECEVEILVENKDNTIQEQLEMIRVSLKKGENRIKLVASDKAKIDIKLQIDVGELNKIGF